MPNHEHARKAAQRVGALNEALVTSDFRDRSDDGYLDDDDADLIRGVNSAAIERWRKDERQKDIVSEAGWDAEEVRRNLAAEPLAASSIAAESSCSQARYSNGKRKKLIDRWRGEQEDNRMREEARKEKAMQADVDGAWRAFCGTGPDVAPSAELLLMPRIMGPTVHHFNAINGLVNRWPTPVRRMLSRSDDGAGQGSYPPPFHTWAQPRYIERRKQACGVWYTLLHFLVANWEDYGGQDGPLAQLGLEPSRECCDAIDDLRLDATIQPQFTRDRESSIALINNFFLLVIRDPCPTPCTNPLLWWIAVLIQSEVYSAQPGLPIPPMQDSLDLSAKLEALDHYARVLVFHDTFIDWTTPPSPPHPLLFWKDEVSRWVDKKHSRVHLPHEEERNSHKQKYFYYKYCDWRSVVQNAVKHMKSHGILIEEAPTLRKKAVDNAIRSAFSKQERSAQDTADTKVKTILENAINKDTYRKAVARLIVAGSMSHRTIELPEWKAIVATIN
ncbi:hypothetical protein LTR85_001035 [Meristemomyces frigidus]|nr:hypothetical protein LTR85_001035 [Meristemomyces frigidus]